MRGTVRVLIVVVAIVALAAVFALVLRDGGPEAASGGELTVFCGAGIRPPMEVIRRKFEAENGCTVKVNYAGSGTALGSLQAGVEADLFVPGDIWWVHKAERMGLVDSYRVAAWFVPVIAVQKGNLKKIEKLADLAREDVRVGLGNRDACAVGNVARDVLAAAGLEGKVEPEYEALTVNRLANQVKIRALDAAIVWDAVAKQYPEDIEIVSIADADFHAVPFALGLLKGGNRELAERFAGFASGEEGAKIFRENGYQVPGPKLRVGCGGSMRPPVEELARRFERETGREVLTNYGSSGTVLLQIEESKEGDVYICHDPYAYKCDERKLSTKWHTVAYIEPALAVQKGNPKKVKGLKDLLRPDLKLGLSHRKYSSRGQILWEILRKNGMAEAMEKRRAFEDRTHSLVNQLKLGAVDVATLWDAPSRAMAEIDVVPIEEEYKVDAVTSATSGKTYSVKRVKVTVVRLSLSAEPLLAAQFARLCVSKAGREVLKRHCFQVPAEP